MKKTVYWTIRAESDLEKVSEFYEKLYGIETSDRIIDTAVFEINQLSYGMTDKGAIDKGLSHLKRTYRKLIIGHIKVSYRVGKDKVYIVRFFDTRQNPSKQK